MEQYAPKLSTVLMTPDPHYIPGYAGYCPQLKFSMGKSYGQLTAELLTCPDVKHSSRLVLYPGHDTSPESDTGLTSATMPDSNLNKMIPGYTGFIPKRQHYFACSYSETCRKALNEFYQERRVKLQRQPTSLPAVVNGIKQHVESPKPPLTAISNNMVSNKPLKSFIPTGKPYFMEDDNPYKYFISGFTGHVPKSHFLIGKGYPITTNQALIQFGKQQRRGSMSQNKPRSENSPAPQMPAIYHSNRGMVPSFTGHIPGYKFMYGHTFGQLSQNALEKNVNKRILQEKP
ncbi:Protein FAM166B [Channa argus]|uniref:Ciliary microtubule inner protein 2B n=1 Tax=Channa argus TaxID=215402 RepID=A0A6G1QHT1_CHAAH|nr:Protein FAM166B [Channa argus]